MMLCTRSDIWLFVGTVYRYRSKRRLDHGMIMKNILEYLQKMKDYICVYHCDELVPLRYMYSNFQSNRDSHKSNHLCVYVHFRWWGYKLEKCEIIIYCWLYYRSLVCCCFLSNKGSFLAQEVLHRIGVVPWLYHLYSSMTIMGRWHGLKNQETTEKVNTKRWNIT